MSEVPQQPDQEKNDAAINQPNMPEEVFVPKLSETAVADSVTNDQQRLGLEQAKLEAISNPDFAKKILPQSPEKVDAKVLDEALETLLKSKDVNISELERMKLFQTTLEYYSSPTEAMLPLWHSTSSFSLRNGLETGFKGGFGRITGEAASGVNRPVEDINEWNTQKDLSVTHPRYDMAETFQQMFARNTTRKVDLAKQLAVDSERITGKTLPEVMNDEFFGTMSRNELMSYISERTGKKPDEITDDYANNFRQAAVNKFNNIEYTDPSMQLELGYLDEVKDQKLKSELEQEIKTHFPCFITFEGGNKMHRLHTYAKGEKPAHIPFEDRFSKDDKLTGEDIREIRVPQSEIPKVQGWLEEKGLKGVKIVPIEVFEIKRIIQAEAEKINK